MSSSGRSDLGVWAPERRRLTVGLVLAITLVAFESLAVATVMPDVSADLGGLGLYGWVFSAFFLGSMVGIVVAGQTTDRLGPASAFALGMGLFALGLVVGGLAPAMPVLVAARFVQGFGAGAVPAVAYVSIGRGYPEPIRPRMFAVLATAWVVPGLLGPSAASLVSHAVGWRGVFLGLLPLVAVAAALALPALAPIGAGAPEDDEGPPPSRLPRAIRVAAGAAAVLAGLGSRSPLLGVVLVVGGAAVVAPAFLKLVPPGTVRAAPGLPAAVLARGVLTFAFFGADAYVPLALVEVRGTSTLFVGLVLTVTTMAWTAGAWTQERLIAGQGARRLVAAGHGLLLVGVLLELTVLWSATPLAVAVVGWAIGGLGIGLSYAPLSVTVLREARPGREGEATSALQLTEMLAVSLGTGVGGAAVALGDARGWEASTGIAIAWVAAAAVAAIGVVVARNLPGPVPGPLPDAPIAPVPDAR